MTSNPSNSYLSNRCIKKKGCIEMQPKIKMQLLQPLAARIKKCVIIHLTYPYLIQLYQIRVGIYIPLVF